MRLAAYFTAQPHTLPVLRCFRPRALEQSKLKLTELREKRQLAALADIPEGEGGEAGGKTGGSKKRRKKGAAAEDMADFYVDDAQPIERLPKGKKDDADVRVSCNGVECMGSG